MKLRTGKNVPFLNKNIPKRKYTKSYKYKEPISKEAEDDLASSFANISLCDKKKPTNEQAVTPRNHRPANRKSLMFEENASSDEEEPIAKYDLSALPFDETEDAEPEVDHVEIVLYALSSDDEEQGIDDEPEIVHVSTIEEDLIAFSAADNASITSDEISDAIPVSDSDNEYDNDTDNSKVFSAAGNESVTSDDDISDAMPVFDSDSDESEDEADDSKVESIFRASTPSQQIGSLLSFLQRSRQAIDSPQWWKIFTEESSVKT